MCHTYIKICRSNIDVPWCSVDDLQKLHFPLDCPEDGKIRFKKPSGKKRTSVQEEIPVGGQKKHKRQAKKNLLSFDDDEDEEDDNG